MSFKKKKKLENGIFAVNFDNKNNSYSSHRCNPSGRRSQFLLFFILELLRGSKNLSFGSLGFSLNPRSAAVEMDQNPRSENGAVMPELMILTEALEKTGRKARLIGQGTPEDFLVSAVVAEFKGPAIFGVVRLAQVNMELAKIEATFSGLAPGKHGWSINQFGDLTMGAASTGKLFNPTNYDKVPLGDLGTLDVDDKGVAFFSGVKEKLRVAEIIGRSIAVYESEDRSDDGLAAAVVARSAGIGENYKKLCTCDGTTIWEATNADFVPSKV